MPGPLSSLKVLDFSTLLPGPFASLLLADMGAEVLRVESPGRPDVMRQMPPLVDGLSASHAWLNRNKRSIALDLKHPEAVELVRGMLGEYDILLEQFRPGVMDKLGLGYATLKEINPALIYVSITGYGQDGPYRDRAGHDINYLALSGIAAQTGRRDTGPVPLGIQAADIAGGALHGLVGLLAAVIQRQQSGQGQQVDISMTDCIFSLHGMAGANWLAGGAEPHMDSEVLNGGSFYDHYRSRDGRWFAVGSLEPQFMQRLCAVLARPDLAALGRSRVDQLTLKRELQLEFEKADFDHWCALFATVDACVEPVLELSEAAAHPQLQARRMIIEVPREGAAAHRQIACPIRFSSGLEPARQVGAALGAHGDEVLAEQGCSAERIAQLRARGVLG